MQSRDLSVFIDDYEEGCENIDYDNKNIAYSQVSETVDELIETLNDINHKTRCLIQALNALGERRASEYLRLYGPGYIDKIIEVLENDTKNALQEAV